MAWGDAALEACAPAEGKPAPSQLELMEDELSSASTASPRCVGMGWTSPEIAAASPESLWAALVYSSRCPDKFMEVSNVVVVDRPGYIHRAMTINATRDRVEEHIYAKQGEEEIVYQVVNSDAKDEANKERVIAIKTNPTRLEFYHRHASDGARVFWEAPLDTLEQLLLDVIDEACRIEANNEVVGLGMRCPAVVAAAATEASHDALWTAMQSSVRNPEHFFPCCLHSVEECAGYVQRTIAANGEKYTENIYEDEYEGEIVYRKVVQGVECDVERVMALRTYPLQLEFLQRVVADGFRVPWNLPRGAPLAATKALVKEALKADAVPQLTIGEGLCSDPIRECSFDSLFSAIETAIREPWRVMDVDEKTCKVQECDGYIERHMTLTSSGRQVIERIVADEDAGEVLFRTLGADGEPIDDAERVLAIHSPLRLELFEHNPNTGERLDWEAPTDVALRLLQKIVELATATDVLEA